MKKQIIFIICTTHILLSFQIKAQENMEFKKLIVSISPQHLIQSGLRFELEPHLHEQHWLTIAPTIYLNHSGVNYYNSDYKDQRDNSSYDKLTGIGIDIQHKMFLVDLYNPSGPYFSYGFGYNHFCLEYEEYVFYNTTYDGLNVITNGLQDVRHHIDRIGASILLGYTYPSERIIMFDLYIGVGLRYSIQNINYDSQRSYDGSCVSFGYSGTLPLAGFKCGFVF